MRNNRTDAKRLMQNVSWALILALMAASGGCAYRRPAGMAPSRQGLRLVAKSPEAYVLRLRIGEPHDYRVPVDGRVTLDVPGYGVPCDVYLLNKIRIRRGANPFSAKTLEIIVAGKVTRQLSLKEIATLPTDAEGYHLLTAN